MQYFSTRSNRQNGIAASVAIRRGIAPDGGLYIPEQIPHIDAAELNLMLNDSYQDLALNILRKYLTDYPLADLETMVRAAYAYPEKFADPKVAPVVQLAEGRYILELWHGPTSAFKDMALQLLPYLLTKAGQLSGEATEVVIRRRLPVIPGKRPWKDFGMFRGRRLLFFTRRRGLAGSKGCKW